MPHSDFAAAQLRVQARRQQHEARARAALERDRQRAAQHLQRLPAPLVAVGQTGAATWHAIRGRAGTEPAFRVGQVDAELLDEELLALLKDQVGAGLQHLGVNLAADWSAEILLGLRAVLFKLSIWDHNASYGASLQGLRYVDARRGDTSLQPPSAAQKSAYGVCTVLGRYAWDKWEDWLLGHDTRRESVRRLARLTSVVSAAHDAAALVSFLVFLVHGRYRTLTDRLLRLRLAPPDNQISRDISFEYLNRQLVWHAFTEFLLFLLPLVGIGRWRRWLGRAWAQARRLVHADSDAPQGELGFLPERTCGLCYQAQHPTASAEERVLSDSLGGIAGSARTDVTNPYAAVPCGCVYCFVCLAERLEAAAGEGFACPRCTELVTACRPWSGDVVEPRPGSKSVTFADADDAHDSGYHTADSIAPP